MIDLHTHILPNIDDGAEDISEALDMLADSYEQGVEKLVLTPHFKGDARSIVEFLSKRDSEVERLKVKAKENMINIPEIYCGAEVLISPELSEFPDIAKLCIGNTDYILLEMPYSYWYDKIFDEIYKIKAYHGLKPIIAHVERYSEKVTNKCQYEKLFSMDVIFQFNAGSFCSFRSRKRIMSIVDRCYGSNFVIGSDCHDMKFRKSEMSKACSVIKKKLSSFFLDEIIDFSEKILSSEK